MGDRLPPQQRNTYNIFASTGGAESGSGCGGGEGEGEGQGGWEHQQLLPIANVGRIMKQILPPNAKVSKEAKETMQECVSEFISFVTSEASDKCQMEQRKTVNGEDIISALRKLGFDDYVKPMRRYLQRYRQQLEGERMNKASSSRH